MIYQTNIIKLLFSMDDHLYRIRKAEKINNLRRLSGLLLLFSMIIYGWMALLGIGTDIISSSVGAYSSLDYEQSKFWFMIGRIAFGLLLALFLLFVIPFIFYGLTEIPYKKLVIMQQVVLCIFLLERIILVPLFLYTGLDWHVSLLSLGIITSYVTDVPWIISFFGAISIFQLWIIWFQVTYIRSLSSSIKKQWIWISVLMVHVFYWLIVALITFVDIYFISGWFK